MSIIAFCQLFLKNAIDVWEKQLFGVTSLYKQHAQYMIVGILQERDNQTPKRLFFFEIVLANKEWIENIESEKTNDNRTFSLSFREIQRAPFGTVSRFSNGKRTRNSHV
jgi:hypothetical protein